MRAPGMLGDLGLEEKEHRGGPAANVHAVEQPRHKL